MGNTFQEWLKSQGYQRKLNSLVWWKNDKVVSGGDLFKKMKEFDKIKNYE